MNNETAVTYYEAQEADLNLRSVYKILASAIISIGIGATCNAITKSITNTEPKSVNFNVPGGDVKVLYNLADTRHEADGDYYEMDFKVILHRKTYN